MAAMPKRKPPADDGSDLLTASDASHVLQTSLQTVRNMANRGELPHIRLVGGNRSRLFRRADVERVAAERRKGPRKSEG